MTTAIVTHPDCLLHVMSDHHPEQPARLRVIEDALSPLHFPIYSAPLASMEQLTAVHEKKYVETIFAQAPHSGHFIIDPDTIMNEHTLNAALRAAGAVCFAVDLIMENKANAVFCNVRPPGHHAEKARAMGFCFFNNAAVGIAHAFNTYHLKRAAIVDFDVHHGNGTEDIFSSDERVLLCSSFQSPFYPYKGANTKNPHILNLALPAGTSGKIFRLQTQQWFRAIEFFRPDIIFFSAGFDGHAEDPLADFLLQAEDYAWITRQIKQIAKKVCKGRIISVLEGGYNLSILGKCAHAHAAEL